MKLCFIGYTLYQLEPLDALWDEKEKKKIIPITN